MAAYHYPVAAHYPPTATSLSAQQHHHHGGNNHRSRRGGPRIASQNAHRAAAAAGMQSSYKPHRSPKTTPDMGVPAQLDYLRLLEAARGFEFDDDEIFCPFNLLTEDDLQSIHSASSSEKGSLSSGSPDGSPIQSSLQPSVNAHSAHQPPPPSLLLSSVGGGQQAYNTAFHHHQQHQQHHHQMKLHQPLAQRTRNAIPIVDPSTRSVASPPMSVSPARNMAAAAAAGVQFVAGRRW